MASRKGIRAYKNELWLTSKRPATSEVGIEGQAVSALPPATKTINEQLTRVESTLAGILPDGLCFVKLFTKDRLESCIFLALNSEHWGGY
jgi:hypothetical protein